MRKTKNPYNPKRTRRKSPLGEGRHGASLLLKLLSSFFFFSLGQLSSQ
jgi:hypothetical protein